MLGLTEHGDIDHNECAACEFAEDCPNNHNLYYCQEVNPPQDDTEGTR